MWGIRPVGQNQGLTHLQGKLAGEGKPDSSDEIPLGRNISKLAIGFPPSALYSVAYEEAKDLLEQLENAGYLDKAEVMHEATPRMILEELISETILNGVNAAAKRFEDDDSRGSQIITNIVIKKRKLWIQVLDNGNGFSEDVLAKVGKQPISSRDESAIGDEENNDGEVDHLYKMARKLSKLGWELIVENRNDTDGASVSIVLP